MLKSDEVSDEIQSTGFKTLYAIARSVNDAAIYL